MPSLGASQYIKYRYAETHIPSTFLSLLPTEIFSVFTMTELPVLYWTKSACLCWRNHWKLQSLGIAHGTPAVGVISMNKYPAQCQSGAYVNNVQSNKTNYYRGRLQAAHCTHRQHPMLLASSRFHYCYESLRARGRLHLNMKPSLFAKSLPFQHA